VQYDFEPLINQNEAADLLRVHPKTLQQMARKGLVPGIRVGKFWRFRKSHLDAWARESVNCPRYAYRPNEEKSK
jgi:excisionase family DNA binding protein